MNSFLPDARVLVTGFHAHTGRQGNVSAILDKAYTVEFVIDGSRCAHDIPEDQLLPVRVTKHFAEAQRAEFHLDLYDDLLAGLAVRSSHEETAP